MLFDGDSLEVLGEAMSPRGAWPPFPWNPADLDNPIIGRDDVLRELTGAFEDVVTDWIVRVQLLVSEGGLGKSRLLSSFVDEARAREPETLVVRAHCPAVGGPYRMWDTILRDAFDIEAAADEEEAGALLTQAVRRYLPEHAHEATPLIGWLVGWEVRGKPVLGLGADEEALVARCVGALGRLLDAIAFQHPLLIIVSGANNASARDFGLASAIEATLKGRPLMMVFAGPPELTDHLPGWDRFPATRLRALDSAESERMLALYLSGLQQPLPVAVVRGILDKCGGNAYALKSMVRYLQEAGGIVRTGDGSGGWTADAKSLADMPIPEDLRGMIVARVAAMNPDERQILAQAAVVGRHFWLGPLVALARRDEAPPTAISGGDTTPQMIRDILRRFVGQRFVEVRTSQIPGEEAFSFRSELHHAVALEILPATVRQRFHRIIGSWLALHAGDEPDPFLLELARHSEGAGLPGDAAVFYLRAARVAVSDRRSGVAMAALDKAEALLKPSQIATRMQVLFELAAVHAYAGATGEAKRYYRLALEWAWRMRDRKRGASAMVSLAEVEQARGEYDAAREHYTEGLRLHEATQNPTGVAAASTALGRLHWLRGEFDAAVRCYRKGEHIYRRLGFDKGIGEVLHAIAAVHYDRGDIVTAEALYTEALALRESSDDSRGMARTLNNLGVIWLDRRLETAVDYWARAEIVARDTGDLGLQATLADNLGEAQVLLGRFEEADDSLRRAVELAELTGRKRTLVDAQRNLGMLRIAMDELDSAEEVLLEASRHADGLGLARLNASVTLSLGELALARHGAAEAGSSDGFMNAAESAFRRAARGFAEAGYNGEAAASYRRLAEFLDQVGRGEAAAEERAVAESLMAATGPASPPPIPG